MKNVKAKIGHDLRKSGIAGCYYGEEFMYLALELIEKDPRSLKRISKDIYPAIAKQCRTSPDCVERNLRTFVARLWTAQDHTYLNALAGEVLTRRPANREFLEIMYTHFIKTE